MTKEDAVWAVNYARAHHLVLQPALVQALQEAGADTTGIVVQGELPTS